MQEHEIIVKLDEWKKGGVDGPLGKWVDTVFDGVGVYAAAIAEQKNILHEFWSAVADHPHPAKTNLLRAANALLICADLKIPLVGNVDTIRAKVSKLDPRLRNMIVDYKMRDLISGSGYEFIHGLVIDEDEAKQKGISQKFWVHAFYSMSISIAVKMARASDAGIPVVAANGGHLAQRILLVSQVLHDIAKYLEGLPGADNKDMGCEIVKLAPLFDLNRFDEKRDKSLLNIINFNTNAWDETWTVASIRYREDIVGELNMMGARIAAIAPNYWLFSRGYTLPREVLRAFKEYSNELKEGPTFWDMFRNFGRMMSGVPKRDQAVIDNEIRLIDGILHCNKMGFLNLRVIHQYADELRDAVNLGGRKTAQLHEQAKKLLRRELFERAQRRNGFGIHIPDNKILQKIREELKRKEASIPSPGAIVGGVKMTRHMLLYGYEEHERHWHRCNYANAQAQKVEAYRYILTHNNAGTLTVKTLIETLEKLCCFRWKLGMSKTPFPNAVPSVAETLCDESITWILQQLVILAGGMGQAETEKTRAEIHKTQRDALIKYVENQAKTNAIDLVEIKILIEAMGWYTWNDFCSESAMGFLPTAGCTKLIAQLEAQLVKQAQPLRDYVVAQARSDTLSMAGLRSQIERMPWCDWSYLQKEPALDELKPLPGANLLEQINAQINTQLEPLYRYIQTHKTARTLSLAGIQGEIAKLGWYSWDDFKKQTPVDFLNKTDVFTLHDQVAAVIESQLVNLYDYIEAQKTAGTLELIDLENKVSQMVWYSWEEFKDHRAVSWLPRERKVPVRALDEDDCYYNTEISKKVDNIFDQLVLAIDEQDNRSRLTARSRP